MKELQENDNKTKEPKKNELKRKRERGKIRWSNMIFFHKKKDREKGEKRKRESRWRNHERRKT